MLRRNSPTPTDDAPDEPIPPATGVEDARAGEPDLATLPIVGITRRRLATILGALLGAWILIVFARQVSEASAATGRAETMVAANSARQAEIAGLERELDQIQRPEFILQQARGYGLGEPAEVAFSLDPAAPPLPSNAPGSAALRVGASSSVSPLERWLTILFGPGD